MAFEKKISTASVTNRYKVELNSLNRLLARIANDIDKLDRDYRGGRITKEMYVLQRGRLENLHTIEKESFSKKWPFIPEDYEVGRRTQKDTVQSKTNEDFRNKILMNSLNGAMQGHQAATDSLNGMHFAQINAANANTPIVRHRKMQAEPIRRALDKFEQWIGTAVKLGIISASEADSRVKTAESDGILLTNESSPMRRSDFIRNLIFQIQDIMKKREV
jgi:hypothetical protein